MQANFLSIDNDGNLNEWATRPTLEAGVWAGDGWLRQVGRIGPDDGASYQPVCVALEGEAVDL